MKLARRGLRRLGRFGALALVVGGLLVVGVGVLFARSSPSEAGPTCTKTWTSAVSGSWSDGTKWTPAGAPAGTDDVCITATGTYTVLDNVHATANSLQLGSTGAGLADLTVQDTGCATTAALDVATTAEVFARGRITLASTCATASTALGTGGLTNDGTVRATSTAGSASITGSVTNRATFTVSAALTYGGVGGTFDNQGTLNVTAPLLVADDFDSTSGSIQAAGSGVVTLSPGTTFAQDQGGADGNPIVLDDADLAFAAGASGQTYFAVQGASVLSGDVPAGATVTLDTAGCAADTTVTTPGSFTNSGTIVLTSTSTGCSGGGPHVELAVGGTFTNAGTFTSADGTTGSRSLTTTTVQNSGTINLQALAPLTLTGDVVLQSSGTVVPTLTPSNNGSVAVSGTITLGGTLDPDETFAPPYSSTFTLFTYADIIDHYEFDTLVAGGIDYVQQATFSSMRLAVLMPSQTTLGASPSTATVYGQPVTLTATVTVLPPNSSTLTGFVGFQDGTTQLGFAPVNSSGVATLVTTALPGNATASLNAYYTSDQYVASSEAPVVAHQVDPAPTTTTISSTPNPAQPADTVTFTATTTVDAPGGGVPTGVVAFWDGPSMLGAVVPTGGVAQLTRSGLSLGTHSVHASYSGDANWAGSDSLPTDQVVARTPTTTALTATANPSVFGEAVALKATVATVPAGGTPTGQVQFTDGATVLGTVTVNGSGVATLTTATLPAGSHPIVASYLGDAGDDVSSSSTVTQVVNKASTTVSVIKLPNPATSGQTVTIKATVSPVAPSGLTPNGTVTFFDGATSLGTATLDASAVATFSSSGFASGSHTIIATFNGTANYLTSSQNSGALFVQAADNTTSLVATPSSVVFGQSVTLTSTTTVTPPASGTPTGNVQFTDGATVLGTVPINAAGVASITTSQLAFGTRHVVATYLGDFTFTLSVSPAFDVTVAAASTTTGLSSSPNPSQSAELVVFTATVAVAAPSGSTPTGAVQFTEGATVLGTSTLTPAGVAQFSTTSLPSGTHHVVATYQGVTGIAGSSSTTVDQVVGLAATTTSLSSAANPSLVGQSVVLTATVAGPSAAVPTGTVTFTDGATTIGTVSVDAAGVAQLPTTALAVGSHTITASYGGDPSFSPSASTPLTQVVDQASTAVGVGLAPSLAVAGEPVMLSSQVFISAPGAAPFTGTMTFRAGATVLGASSVDATGFAGLTTSAVPVGSSSITAQYSGSADLMGSTSSGQTLTVSKASTTTALSSAPSPSSLGQMVAFTAHVAVTSPGGGTPTGPVTFTEGATVLGTGSVDASGDAHLSIDTLPVGSHSIGAAYAGDTQHLGSTSNTLTQDVTTLATTTALTSAPNPSVAFQQVTFTATVSVVAPGVGVPTGDVTFTDGPFTLGTAPVSPAGVAVLATSSLPVGSHSVIATYGGDSAMTGSASTVRTQVVNQLPTSTSLASTPNPSVSAEFVTLTATVTTAGPTVGAGTVDFTSDGSFLGSALVSSGVAQLSTTGLQVGTHSLVATYTGVSGLGDSTSSTVTQVVTQAATSTALASTPNPSLPAEAVTFTAAVTVDAPGHGLATGTVTFKEGATVLGTSAVDGSGEAQFMTTALTSGTHSVTATYSGDAELTASTSLAVDQVVAAGTSTTTLASSANPSASGQAVTLTATVAPVAPATGIPTGTVTFTEGATLLGTAPVQGTGQASITRSTLAVGTHPIVATYGGDANVGGSASSALGQVVAQASTTTTLASDTSPSVPNQSVTFSAKVTPAFGAPTPTGTVTFTDGATVLGTAPVDAGWNAAFSTTALAVGDHSIVATYGGDADFTGSASSAFNQAVVRASTLTFLSVAPTPSVAGEPVTFTADVLVLPPGTGTATGTVTFTEGATVLGTAPVTAGSAELTTSTLSVGTHPVVATYGGSATVAGSASSAEDQVVDQASTTTALSSSPNPSVPAQAVVFSVTVTTVAPATGAATGTVTFSEGATVLGTGAVSPAGLAQLSTTALGVGSHSVTATYGGDGAHAGSASTAVDQVVAAGASTTTLSSSANPSASGQGVTLTATIAPVAPATGTPTGTVTFTEGATVLGTSPVSAAGDAQLATSSLTVGTHPIVATYSGDAALAGSASAALDQLVAQAGTTTGLTSTPNPSLPAQSVTFTATVAVTAPGAGTPTGTVTFTEGATVLGTSPVSALGAAQLATTSLTVGTHPIVATYSGDAAMAGSASAALDQAVGAGSTTTGLAATPNPSVAGQSVAFAATVTAAPGSPAPTGTVTFREGATVLGTATVSAAGDAVLDLTTLAVGTHPVVATYGGDANLTGSASAALDQVVVLGATSTALTSSPNPSAPAQAVIFSVTVTVDLPATGVATGTVTFTEGATVLGTSAVSPAGLAQFSTTSLAVGSHPVVATYDGDADRAASSSPAVVQVVQVPVVQTVTTLDAAPTGMVATQPFDLSAQVATVPAGGAVPGGIELREGATVRATATVGSDGRATFHLAHGIGGGTHQLTAGYLGSTFALPSDSAAVTMVVGKAQGSFTTSAVLDPTKPGTVTFLVLAKAQPPASSAPGGAIELRQDGVVIGTGRLVDGRAVILQCFTPVCAPPTTTTTTAPTTTTSSTSTSTTTTSPTTTSSTTSTTDPPRTTTTQGPTTTEGGPVPTVVPGAAPTAAPATPAVPIAARSGLVAQLSASAIEVVAGYPGDDDFDAYQSDPIQVGIDGDTVSLPGDTPPPTVTTTTTPTTGTSTPLVGTTIPGGAGGTGGGGPGITGEAAGGSTTVPGGSGTDSGTTVTTAAGGGTNEDASGTKAGATDDPSASGSGAGAGVSAQGSGRGVDASSIEHQRSLSAKWGRSALAMSTADPTEISTDPGFVLQNVLLTMFLLLFSVYPAYIINNTLAENYDEVLGWFGPVDRRIERFRSKRGKIPAPIVLGLSGLIGAILYSFLDPNIGLNMPSAALFLGLFASTLTISGVYDVARKRYLHHHYGYVSSLRGYPIGVFIGIILVVFSRAAHFTPGYLFGVFTALGFSREIDRRHDGRGVAAAAVWLFGIAVASWFLWIPVANAAAKPYAGFVPLFLDTTLATIWVVGIQTIVFGLMPLRFLDGEKVLYWSKAGWAAVYGLGMFAFVHSMVRPGTKVDGDSFTSAVVLFVGFTLFAGSFWAYFRFRTSDPGDTERPTEGPEADALIDA
ncbi:Ig-like domain repeat protein [Aquihabitans sp. McL0605]|uniref:Ig-like domain repeat protein n=1 Tax=Aquihabitans sp. McL0605 TaxID=3415671 RepID=UPI003CF8C7C2